MKAQGLGFYRGRLVFLVLSCVVCAHGISSA